MEKLIYKNYPQKGQRGFQKTDKTLCFKCKKNKRHRDFTYCKECWNEYKRKYYLKNSKKHKDAVVKSRKKKPEVYEAIRKRHNLKLKTEVLLHYGKGKLECACCGEKEIKFLTIDHIDNDGAEERRKLGMGKGGREFYCYLRKNNYPKKNYQVLCLNCNRAKYDYGICPHQLNKQTL